MRNCVCSEKQWTMVKAVVVMLRAKIFTARQAKKKKKKMNHTETCAHTHKPCALQAAVLFSDPT